MRVVRGFNWRVYLPPLVGGGTFVLVGKFLHDQQNTLKLGHDFLPIYDEEGKLVGFTHPTLVDAADNLRQPDE